MLDQMFTAENFRRVFDVENRKGLDVAGRFFPALEPHTLGIRNKVKEIREVRAKAALLTLDVLTAKVASLKVELADLKAKKFIAIDHEMETISDKVSKPSFKLVLTKKMGPKGRSVFCIDGSPETFFVIKQLQRNISRIYGVKQSNRHDLVCQLRDTLTTSFPFSIVRTDISSFYESIDRKRLLEKLDQDQLLSSSSKKYIKQV
ncbi:MAG: reverse transcriptase, partial [Alphaproteobacteria bacterium]